MKKTVLGMVLLGGMALTACGFAGSNTVPTVSQAPQTEQTNQTQQSAASLSAQNMPKSSALKKSLAGELKTQGTLNNQKGEFMINERLLSFAPEQGEEVVIPLVEVLFIIQSETGIQFQTRQSITEFALPLEFVRQLQEYFYMSRSQVGRVYR